MKSIHSKQNATFSGLIIESFWLSQGAIVTFLGFVFTIIGFLFLPKELKIGLRFVIPMAMVAVYMILVMSFAAWSSFSHAFPVNPSLRYGLQPPLGLPNAVALLLFDPSPLYAHDSIVSLYFLENEFERLIGVGRVYNIQEDGKIQVLVMRDMGFGNEWQSLAQNDAIKMKGIRVKPTVPSYAMELSE